MIAVRQWSVFEAVLESDRDYDNPFWDVTVAVQITTPSGERRAVDAFWDGGRTWRVRVCPDEVGEWHWSTVSSEPHDAGAHGREGGSLASRTRATTRSTSMVPCAWPPAVTTWSMLTGHRSCG